MPANSPETLDSYVSTTRQTTHHTICQHNDNTSTW